MRRYFEWVLAHRTGVLLWSDSDRGGDFSVSRAVLASSMGEMFFGMHRYLPGTSGDRDLQLG